MGQFSAELFDLTGSPVETVVTLAGVATVSPHAVRVAKGEATLAGVATAVADTHIKHGTSLTLSAEAALSLSPSAKYSQSQTLYGVGSAALNGGGLIKATFGTASASSAASLGNMVHVQFVGGGVFSETFCSTEIVVSDDELRMRKPYTRTPKLEELRLRALVACSTSDALPQQAHAIRVFAHQAEYRSLFDLLVGRDPALDGAFCSKRKAVEADAQLQTTRGVWADALKELRALGVPDAHLRLLQHGLDSRSFNHRVSALCATVFLAAIILRDVERN